MSYNDSFESIKTNMSFKVVKSIQILTVVGAERTKTFLGYGQKSIYLLLKSQLYNFQRKLIFHENIFIISTVQIHIIQA